MGFLDKLLGRKPESDAPQAAAEPAAETAVPADTAVTPEHDHDHDHGEGDHSH
ncbi:MAG TPA: hypothetical protein VLK53_05995 [Gaiellaceae bacterium]|jgi:hypothetical protein|nr:hypothetical protein [Gaiellaceae bacterium]